MGGKNHPGSSTHRTRQVGRWRNFPGCRGGQQCQAQQPEGQVSRTLVKPPWKVSSSGRWGRAAEVQRAEGSVSLDLGGWIPARMGCSERSSSLPGPTPNQPTFARVVNSMSFALRQARLGSQLPQPSNCMTLEVTMSLRFLICKVGIITAPFHRGED